MYRRFLVGLTLGLIALALPMSAFAGASIVNGSFEGTTSVGSFKPLGTGSTAIDGWTVASGSVDWIGTYWTAFDGERSIDLNGSGPGALSQVLATDPGASYEVTFELAGNGWCGDSGKILNVSVDGGSSSSYSFDTSATTRSNMGWSQQSYQFTATGTSSLLLFASGTSGGCGPALDLVTITELTAPAALTVGDCKRGGWQHMTDSYEHSFRNQGDCVSFYATDGKNLASGTD